MGGRAPTKTKTILVHEWVTGGGLAGHPLPDSWAAEGHAMRRAIARDFASLAGVRVVVTLDERFPDEPGPWEIVRVGPGEEKSRLARLAAEADGVALIAPESGGALARRAGLIQVAGGRSLGSSPEAIKLTGDKHALGRHLKIHKIATPPSRSLRPQEGLPRSADYPAVLKPRDGAGSLDTYFIESPGDCPDEAKTMTDAILQPYIPGTPMSASFLVELSGWAHPVGVGWQRMNIEGGRFVYKGGRMPAPMEWADRGPRQAAEAVSGLLGFVGVDFIRDEATGKTTVIEINPRPTTSYVGLARLLPAGFLALGWLAAAEGDTDAVEGLRLARMVASQRPITFDADGGEGGE